jgi:hypothetical protein
MSWEEHMNRAYETKMTKGFLNMEMPEQIKTEHYSNLEKLLHKPPQRKEKYESI